MYEYLSYIEDAYLIFSVPLYSESFRKSKTNPQKIYGIDTALADASRLSRVENKGRYLENLVYLDLLRRGHEIFYYLTNNRHEVDFFSKSPDSQLHLYQVCWDLSSPKTSEREIQALTEAEKELNIKGAIITAKNFAEWALKNTLLFNPNTA